MDNLAFLQAFFKSLLKVENIEITENKNFSSEFSIKNARKKI